MANVTYNPAVFDVPDETAARRIILTPEGGQSPEERWARETPYLGALIAPRLPLAPGAVVADFGCGIGRMAKELIGRLGCRVLGVDISQDMRSLAPGYVASHNFSAVSPQVFAGLVEGGLRVDAAIAVWVLQHCAMPGDDIGLIARSLKPNAPFFVVNSFHRAVPAVEKAWANDGLDIRAMLHQALAVEAEGRLDPAVVGASPAELTFWGCYRRR